MRIMQFILLDELFSEYQEFLQAPIAFQKFLENFPSMISSFSKFPSSIFKKNFLSKILRLITSPV